MADSSKAVSAESDQNLIPCMLTVLMHTYTCSKLHSATPRAITTALLVLNTTASHAITYTNAIVLQLQEETKSLRERLEAKVDEVKYSDLEHI